MSTASALRALALVCLVLRCVVGTATSGASKIDWQPWSEAIWTKAKAEKKLVLLDMEAVWCHWCHVMDEKTYADARVSEYLGKHFVTVKVDQDSRPDLSTRYQEWGWPATILFDSSGNELAKRSGYIPADQFLKMLEAFVKDPTPGPSVVAAEAIVPVAPGALGEATRKEMVKLHRELYDDKKGGWAFVHKFIYGPNVEYAIRQARRRDKPEAERAKTTLRLNLKLQDPAWGGVYQYSVEGWDEHHFEKIMSSQATNLTAYSLGLRMWNDPKYRGALDGLYRYLTTFLVAPDGGFYTSQDADLIPGKHSEGFFKLSDAARRKQGIPRVDTHQYARENGLAAEALCQLYAATGEAKHLDTAKRAVEWAMAKRSLSGGGFRHDEKDVAGPYLADNLAMGRALLSLYMVTAERPWLQKALASLKFIDGKFRRDGGGFISAQAVSKQLVAQPIRDENTQLARFANLLHHYTGDSSARAAADHAMKYLASKQIVLERPTSALLVTDDELRQDPIHVTVVGAKQDAAALELFKAALAYPENYMRVEWWDKAEGPLPRADVTYPQLAKSAAFLCTGTRCSLPIYDPKTIRAKIDALLAPPTTGVSKS